MYTLTEPTTVFGISELRTKLAELLHALKNSSVMLALRNKPFAVVMSFARYQALTELAEAAEDQYLGAIAVKRAKQRHVKYIPLATLKKRLART